MEKINNKRERGIHRIEFAFLFGPYIVSKKFGWHSLFEDTSKVFSNIPEDAVGLVVCYRKENTDKEIAKYWPYELEIELFRMVAEGKMMLPTEIKKAPGYVDEYHQLIVMEEKISIDRNIPQLLVPMGKERKLRLFPPVPHNLIVPKDRWQDIIENIQANMDIGLMPDDNCEIITDFVKMLN